MSTPLPPTPNLLPVPWGFSPSFAEDPADIASCDVGWHVTSFKNHEMKVQNAMDDMAGNIASCVVGWH
jgi:hypothetical protein